MFGSDDLALLRHPFGRYEALRDEALRDEALRDAAGTSATWRSAALRVGRLMLILGLFVSITTTGRVLPIQVAGTMAAWCFAPLVQSIAVLTAAAAFARGEGRARVLDLYFAGHGPWLLFMVITAGLVVVPFHPTEVLFFLLAKGIAPVLFVLTFVWGIVLNVAMFRSGLGLTRGKAALATALFYLLFVGQVVGYYLLNDAIQPQLGMK